MSNIDLNDVVAHVKPEYIIPHEPPAVEKKLESQQDSSEDKKESPDNKDSPAEPPSKKQKLTGQNRHRPKLIKAPKSSKLCKSAWCLRVGEKAAGRCTNERCAYSHDIDAFLEAKPEDLTGECYNYVTYGMCHFGVICRYGKDHIQDKRNKVNEELWSKYENKQMVFNTLNKGVQFDLRKRKYDFGKALSINKKVRSELDKKRAMEKKQQNGRTEEVKSETLEPKSETLEPAADDPPIVPAADDPPIGPAADDDLIKLNSREKKKINWRGKTYLAPLTTLGNLPFRRICKDLGADITCSEMAVATNLLQGSPSEWALVKRHASEDLYGVQLCGSNAEAMTKCAQLLDDQTNIDFVDINMGCPIDLIYKQGGGSALLRRQGCLEHMVLGMTKVLSIPLTLKMRTAVYHDTRVAHDYIEKAKLWDVSMVTLHGRSREQRYLKVADWNYINECASIADPIPLFGNGDIMSYEDYYYHYDDSKISGIMIGRAALIKPWIFKEIKEKKHWDISSSERFDLLKKYSHYGMEHWGSDSEGIEKTRRFLLEWLSFMHRYIPVGILDQTQKINQRPPLFKGRDYLETLMASRSVNDWVKISEMLLGPTPDDFNFLPKHRASAY